MAFNVSYNFIAKDKFSRIARKIQSAAVILGKKIKDTGNSFKRAIPKIDKFKRKLNDLSISSRRLGQSLATKLTLPIAAFGAAALFQSAKMETFQVSFDTMLGSAKRATKLMSDLKRFSAETPFKLEGIAASTKTLLSFGVVQKDMIGSLRMLGDISAGTGAPLQDIAQIFGKSKAKAKLMTEELLQLAERGIPIIQDLSDHFGVLPADIFKAASKSQISFTIMQESLKRMTSEGGIFFEQTKKQSRTLAGLWSTFTDNIVLSLAAFGDMNVKIFGLKDVLKKIIGPLSKLPEKIALFTKEHPRMAEMLIIFGSVLAILGPLLIAIGLLGAAIPFIVTGFGALASVVVSTFVAMKFGLLALFSPIGLLIAAIAAIGFVIFKNWDAIVAKISEVIIAIKKSSNSFIALASILVFTFLALFSPIGLLIAAIAAIGFAIFKNWDAIVAKTSEIIIAMKKSFHSFMVFVIGLFGEIGEIGEVFGKVGNAIVAKTSEIIMSMKESFTDFINIIINLFTSIPEKIKEAFLGVKSFIDNIIGGIFDKIGGVLSGIFSFIGDTKNKTADFFNATDTNIQQTMTTNQMLSTQASAQANVNVNLSAPRNTIDSIQTQVTGDRQAMNLGTTLVTQ